MFTIPIAITLEGFTELMLVVGTIVTLNLYDDYYGFQPLNESVAVRAHDLPFGNSNYYCPRHCQAEHSHLAHYTTKECNNCDHWVVKGEEVDIPRNNQLESDSLSQFVAGNL